MTTRPVEPVRGIGTPVGLTIPVPARQVPAQRDAGRSLLAYLLLPRPGDLGKAVIVPVAFGLGALAAGGTTWARAAHAALVWPVLELLVYQARYQWNDIRGFHADQRHPEASTRGRLPGPLENARAHISASLVVAGVRLALAGLVALLVPALAATVLVMTVAVFLAAAVYETTRSAATGRQTGMPEHVTPALRALWLAVGAGYAVRGMTGLYLAVDLRHRLAGAVAAAVAMWALGVVFVTCRWALEGLCFARVQHGVLTWRVPENTAREHSLALARWLPAMPSDDVRTPKAWRALSGRTAVTAPWNLALLVAAAAAALTGWLLAAPAADDLATVALALAAGAAAAWTLMLVCRRSVLLLLIGAATVAGTAAAGRSAWAAGVVGALVAGCAYTYFTHQCPDEIGQPLRGVRRLFQR